MRRATADKRERILEDLDFADDIAVLSSKFNDLHKKTGRLTGEAARAGLKLDARKCKTLRTEYASNREGIVVNDREVEDVEEFLCLGATFDKEGGGSKDNMNRLQKARSAFQRLGKSEWNRKDILDIRTDDIQFQALHRVGKVADTARASLRPIIIPFLPRDDRDAVFGKKKNKLKSECQ